MSEEDEEDEDQESLNNSLTAMDWLQKLNAKDVGQNNAIINSESNIEDKNKPPYRYSV